LRPWRRTISLTSVFHKKKAHLKEFGKATGPSRCIPRLLRSNRICADDFDAHRRGRRRDNPGIAFSCVGSVRAGRRRRALQVPAHVVLAVKPGRDHLAEFGRRALAQEICRDRLAAGERIAMAAPYRRRAAARKFHRFHERRGIERHRRANRPLQAPKHPHHPGVVVVIASPCGRRAKSGEQECEKRQPHAGAAQSFGAQRSGGRFWSETFHPSA
jgi:hypothetical protein